ncbi:hypothetical protein QVD17_08254 [Tagetes erecta]|uniref:Chalcone-flavonone isomerase family protein n=1 Tax=Tagetes erecta TaxID=13708 RepID=A0AAD8KXV6_TARER|nr:hypothetical protein QVD17_08254 [Tagetes erecta]
MANLPSTTSIQVEAIVFPPTFKPPGATNTLFLGGAGVRCMEIQGKIMKMTGLAMYLDEKAIPSLEAKWKGKTAEELKDSNEFYGDIISGSFEKCIQITTIVPITGVQFSEKVCEICVKIWKAKGTYTDEDGKSIDKFLETFKEQKFPPGSTILLAMSSNGSLMVTFSQDGVIPEAVNATFENVKLGQAIYNMMIGTHGVSPEAKQSLATRVSQLLV